MESFLSVAHEEVNVYVSAAHSELVDHVADFAWKAKESRGCILMKAINRSALLGIVSIVMSLCTVFEQNQGDLRDPGDLWISGPRIPHTARPYFLRTKYCLEEEVARMYVLGGGLMMAVSLTVC